MLCTSGFVDDAMFSHNGFYGTLCIFPKRPEHNSLNCCIDYDQILFNNKDRQLNIVGCIPGCSLLSTIAWINFQSI